MIHDLVITGGAVATINDALPRADWVAITHGLVSAVGVGDAPEAHQVLDAAGGLILPGFNDAHCNTMWFGLSLAEVDCKSFSTLAALYDALVERAGDVGPRGWVLATGYNQEAFEGLYPDITVLDQLLPNNPLFMRHTSGHACRLSQNSGLVPKYRAKRIAVSAVTPRLPRMISLMRMTGTSIALASDRWLMSSSSRNSLCKISPGEIGRAET